jgi:hypothetical protein
MGVETSPLETSYNFPSHDLPAKEKGAEWCKQFLRAMYTEATTRQYAKIFFAARDDYRKFKEYALSAQSVLPYRKWLTGSESNDKTWVNINWTIPTIGTKYRNILVNKLLARKYNITCTPIDPLAVDATNKKVAGMKAKVMLTEMAKKINPALLKTNTLTKKTGDPEDMEDLQMRGQLGFKFELAMDAELGIQVLFNQNRIKQERKMVIEDLVDLGIGIYKDWIDENDQVRFERVNPINFICNYCRRGDFKDMDFGAQMKWMTLGELSPYFTNAELKDMAENVAGRNGNPRTVPYNFSQADYDKFKVMVMDGEWLSYNADVYKRYYDGQGNYGFSKSKQRPDGRKGPEKENSEMEVDVNGKLKKQYVRDDCQVVYKGMWVVDTEYVFNYGLATDQIRKKGDWRKTRLSFHIYAPDFYEMKALGVVERMVPFIDDYCRTWYKIQNFFNRWIPYIVNIDLAAIENIPLGKGGVRLKHMEVLDMLFQTFILPTRQKSAITGMNEPNKPVSIEATQMAEEITVLLNNLQTAIQQIRAVTGLNEVVDGTGPAERTNVPAQQQAQQGSNNAIAHFQTADSMLLEDLSESLLMRLQRVLKRGKKVSGYVQSLGSNAIKFAQISPDISLHEYAIDIEDQPDDDMKQMLLQQLAIQDQKGLILPEDYFTIVNMTNLKEMELKLIYSSKKRQQAMEQSQMAQQQNAAATNAQSSIAIETAKQATIKAKGDEDRKTADVVGSWQVKAAEVKAKVALDAETIALMKEIALEAMGQFHDNGQGFGAPGGPGGPQGQQPGQPTGPGPAPTGPATAPPSAPAAQPA